MAGFDSASVKAANLISEAQSQLEAPHYREWADLRPGLTVMGAAPAAKAEELELPMTEPRQKYRFVTMMLEECPRLGGRDLAEERQGQIAMVVPAAKVEELAPAEARQMVEAGAKMAKCQPTEMSSPVAA